MTLIVATVAIAIRLSIQCCVVPTYPTSPNAADFVDDVVAAAVMDLVLRGRRAWAINFGNISPISAFDLLVVVVEVFDRGMPVSDWIELYRHPDPRVNAALADIWRKEVWPAFTAHFGIAYARRSASEFAGSVSAETRRKQLRNPAFFLDLVAYKG